MVRTWGLGGQWQFRFENLGIWAGHNTFLPTSVCTPSVLGVLTRMLRCDWLKWDPRIIDNNPPAEQDPMFQGYIRNVCLRILKASVAGLLKVVNECRKKPLYVAL